jgi:hypothetical protein
MFESFVAWLLATFVLAPLQSEIDARLAAAQVPPLAVERMRSCVAAAPPVLARRAGEDWIWAASTITRAATGLVEPKDVLASEVPVCRPAVEAIRPFLAGAAT